MGDILTSAVPGGTLRFFLASRQFLPVYFHPRLAALLIIPQSPSAQHQQLPEL
jgi:hypothetical protein